MSSHKPEHDTPNRLLSPVDLEADYGLHRDRWRMLMRIGAIPAFCIGARLLARKEDAERWLEGRRYVPTVPGEGPH